MASERSVRSEEWSPVRSVLVTTRVMTLAFLFLAWLPHEDLKERWNVRFTVMFEGNGSGRAGQSRR